MKKFEMKFEMIKFEMTHLKRPWCLERLNARGEGDDRGWDGWMASPTRWTWVWVNSGSWWWTGRPGILQSLGSQRVWHDWATELNWNNKVSFLFYFFYESSMFLFLLLSQIYWTMMDKWNCTYLGCTMLFFQLYTMWQFNICCEMIITIKLTNTSIISQGSFLF